jgi:hypothetical protein
MCAGTALRARQDSHSQKGVALMRCPQCGTESPDDAWNCSSCRINLYWAHQHYHELARIRDRQGLETRASTPSFLVTVHKRALQERASRGGDDENKVRRIARQIMKGETEQEP